MGWAGHVASTGVEKCIQGFSREKLMEGNHLGYTGIYGRILFIWFFKK